MDEQYIAQVNRFFPDLIDRIDAQYPAFSVPIVPEADAGLQSCFYNVERKVTRDGGKLIYGWAIRFSEFMIEAEMHAIWQSEVGVYLDVTPPIVPLLHTVFIRDERLVFNGKVIDNVRINISGNPMVDDWIRIKESINRVFAYGDRKAEHIVDLPEAIVPLLAELEEIDNFFLPFITGMGNDSSRCFCGRDFEYQHCHGRWIRVELNRQMEEVAAYMKTA
ncbi:MAG: hypothetical protein EOP48_07795 [Sphingobacteriales bacterium]|nr:MAG: hypothetical protein EOP48_07795 [Sphingobacteriales bacterium]